MLRQPGAVIVREFVPELGPIMRRVEVGAGVQPTIGADVQFERRGGEYVLTGGA